MAADPDALFEWDEAKSEKNLLKHGFDFGFAKRIFEGSIIEREDTRRQYGEKRFLVFGQVEGEILVIVYTWRGACRRIISARRASRRERDGYREAYPAGDR